MRVRVGTSGFSYDAWTGPFYPAGTKAGARLAYYATRLDAVEINNTFYRMPRAALLEAWRDQVPDGFVFVLKAPQRITHVKRLAASAAEDVKYLLEAAAALTGKRGPFLFQTPPHLRKDAARLREFLTFLPEGTPAAFEFRHESWQDDEVRAALAERGAALCLADTDEGETPPLVATGSFGYLRLRRADYGAAELARWAEQVLAQPWDEAFVFFKHEDAGRGPALAAEFKKAVDAGRGGG
ncbi:MAG TPA: DUF72 domain-containing protein [Vicinamibacteria bacterium]|nr:DUF72 domain-containing protein [Vicinamibacteria bacterium]